MSFTWSDTLGIKVLAPDGKQEIPSIGFSDKSSPRLDLAGKELLKKAFQVEEVLSVHQVHGSVVWKYLERGTGSGVEADAIVFSRGSTKRLFAIKTADCVPILVSSSRLGAVIHAGWRGLGLGIISETLKHFKDEEEIRAYIGPCARGCCYEVGAEVLKSVPHSKTLGEKFLDTGATAGNQIRAADSRISILDSGLCTICNDRFNSYRRDGNRSGRNISFIVS